MKNKYLFLGSLFLLSPFALAESVQKICSTKPVNYVRDLQGVDASVCELVRTHNDVTIQKAAEDSRAIIRKLEESLKNEEAALFGADAPAPDGIEALSAAVASGDLAALSAAVDEASEPGGIESNELTTGLQKLAKTLTEKRGTQTFSTTSNSPLSQKVSEMFESFGTVEERNSDKQGFYNKMVEVLKLTSEGKRVAECFERTENSSVAGRSVEFQPTGSETSSPSAAYEVKPTADGKFQKVITIDAGPNPALTLSLLAHEMQHACNTENFIKFRKQSEANAKSIQDFQDRVGAGDLNAAEEAEKQRLEKKNYELKQTLDVQFAIDEMRAYAMTPKVFAEIAPLHPQMFCENYYVSSLFGKQVLSTGEYMSTLESQFENKNKFIHTLIESYSKGNGYDIATFYEFDEETMDLKRDAAGMPKLKESVKSQLAQSGFPVP